MPQIQLPIFPAGSVEINPDLACRTEGDQVVYFNGHLPVFTHAKNDLASFRPFTSQLIVQGSATQGHIAKAFGVPLVAIKRATKLYRQRGAAGFFVPKTRRHVRVYHGSLGPLPRQYVARQKLLLRGTTDYWVNGLGGEPFFVVTQPIHEGLIAALRQQVIPHLLRDAPQPQASLLQADAQIMRLMIVFDREGFSPKFFAELTEQRIGFLTLSWMLVCLHRFPE
jgi:hypothetical protein